MPPPSGLGLTLLGRLRTLWRVVLLAGRLLRLLVASLVPRRSAPPVPVSPSGETALFFYSQVVWDEVWQRPQECALRMARQRPVVFCGPVQIHRLYDTLGRWRREQRPEVAGGGDLLVWTPLIFPGEYKCAAIRAVNRLLLRLEMRRVVGSGGDWVFLTNSPFSAFLLDRFAWRGAVYDIIDDFAAFDWAPPGARAWHDRLIAACDRVVTGTGRLLDDVQVRRPEAVFLPSGVDFDLFHQVAVQRPPRPPELAGCDGPIVGYAGSLSDRLDRDLLTALADQFPQAWVVLVGPVHGSFGEPLRRPNMLYVGLVAHERLPDFVAWFDVALIPSRTVGAALATHPVKALEYLAAGRPVVSTALPDMMRYHSDSVRIGRSRSDFLRLVGEVLSGGEDDGRRERGIEKARGAAWDETARRLLDAVAAAENR